MRSFPMFTAWKRRTLHKIFPEPIYPSNNIDIGVCEKYAKQRNATAQHNIAERDWVCGIKQN